MRRVGVYLIYAAVALRALVRLAGEPWFGLAATLLSCYGLLLVLAERRIADSDSRRVSEDTRVAPAEGQDGRPLSGQLWLPLVYLVVQSGLVVGMLFLPPILDYFGLLFIPLSLEAVFFFGRRFGLLCVGVFFLIMAGPLFMDQRGWVFGLTMTVLNTGYCLLFSGYAHQVRRAETVQRRNRRMLEELQVAHRQLQAYAAQVEGLAAERERSRLARELHDSVTQTVFSMNLTVQSARLMLRRAPEGTAGQLERLEELARSAMGEIQALVTQLRPRSVAEEGLPQALCRLAAEREARDGLHVAVEIGGEAGGENGHISEGRSALPPAVAEGVYQIAQEALSNVAKHAGTGQATIRLTLTEGASALEVEDAGRGFDPQTALTQRGHLGLAGMAERAREMGWSLSIDSRPGRGTRVRVGQTPAGGAT